MYGKLRKRASVQSRKELFLQFKILKSLVEKDKSVLPACISLQNRGNITFPHQSFLPFARNCSSEIKKYLNTSTFKKHGCKVMLVSSKKILCAII